jgi:hypothetical protein
MKADPFFFLTVYGGACKDASKAALAQGRKLGYKILLDKESF